MIIPMIMDAPYLLFGTGISSAMDLRISLTVLRLILASLLFMTRWADVA